MSLDVYPVSAASAAKWALGEINDGGLVRGVHHVVYMNELLGRENYPAFLRAVVSLTDAGCRAGIAHVTHPAMIRRYLRYGAVPVRHERIEWRGQVRDATRIVCPPLEWEKWVSRIRKLI